IRCSFCGAPAGELCRTETGREILSIGTMHNARITPTRANERHRRLGEAAEARRREAAGESRSLQWDRQRTSPLQTANCSCPLPISHSRTAGNGGSVDKKAPGAGSGGSCQGPYTLGVPVCADTEPNYALKKLVTG